MPPTATPPAQQSNPQQIAFALKTVIESVYTDGISAVLKTTQASDGTITGKFADGPQVYDFSISPDNKITYNETEATGGRSDAYLIGYTMDSGFGLKGERLDAPTSGQKTPKCEKGKRCGGGCVQQGLACRQTLSPQASQAMVPIRSAIASRPAAAKVNAEVSQNPKEVSQRTQLSQSAQTPSAKGLKADHVALAAGALLMGVPAAAYAASVLRYRGNLDKSAQKAIELSKSFEVPDEVKGGMRPSALGKENGVKGITLKKDADQVTLVVNGFGGTGGTAGDYFAAQLARTFKNHHVVGVENPEFDVSKTSDDVPDDKVTEKRLKTMLGTVINKGENPVAIRMAGQAYAYHKKTGKPINLVGYSAGGMVAHETAELLKRMGVKDVRVATMASPHFGLVPLAEKSINFLSGEDPASEMPGFKTKNTVKVPASSHMGYLVDEKLDIQYNPRIKTFVPTGKVNRKTNTATMDHLKTFFERKSSERGDSFDLATLRHKQDSTDKGKPCGKGHIAAELKCRIGQAGSDLKKKKSSTTKSVAIDPKIAAVVAGAALIGMPAIAYASSVRDYRQGFSKSAEEIDGMSKEFESKIKKDAVDRTGKPENELTREDIYAVDRYASGSDKKRTFSVDPKKPYIAFTVGGLNDYGEDGTGMAVTLKKTLGKDSIIPLTNKKVQITPEDTWLPMNDLLDDTLDPDGKGGSVERGFLARRGATKALKTLLGEKYPDVLKGIRESKNYTTVEPIARVAIRSLRDVTMLSKNAIKNGENADAKDIAAQMLTFHKAYPDKPLRIIAHSGGGAAAAEAAEILNRKGIKAQVANIGTPFFGLTKLPPDQLITIASTGDYMMKLPAQNRVAVSDVTAHNWVGHAGSQGYGGSAEVKSALRQFLYGEKPSQKKTDGAANGADVGKFVAALLKPAIRQVYSDVSQVANVKLKGAGVTGVFTDSNGDAFQFEISAGGRLTYKAATRKDAEQDQCEKGMQCGSSCVPQGDQCNSGLSASAQAIAQLAVKTLKTEELPSRLEVARVMGTATKEFLRNPVKALKEGVQREAAVRESIKAQTGVIVPSQTEILKKAGQKMTSFVKGFVKKNAEEGVVNTAGLAGSIVGGAVAGPIGALAGDLAGAVATRKAVTDYKALQRAKSKLADDEAFKSAGSLSKLKILGAATLAELKSPEMQREIEDNATGDVAGWAIGNASAVALTAMGVNIPLKGAAVAIATTPSVVKAHRRIREGEAAGKVIREAARDLASLPKNVISRGEDREKAARQEATRKIQRLKAAVATTAVVGGVVAVRNLRNKD